MFELENIQSAFSGHEPIVLRAPKERRASVALILNGDLPTGDPSIIFIERAFHSDDPWSGHMALPGGRFEMQDRNLLGTARRETREEIGVDLSSGTFLGRLDDLQGKRGSKSTDIVIACFVFQMPQIASFVPNREVADIVNLQVSRILDPATYTIASTAASDRAFPGISIDGGDRIIWGLTYRFLRLFFSLMGYDLPPD
ncbi:MAG: hypothetical protein CL398_07525 [Acidiferrobacteraceae bacterium]|nr:hypothetical protein [Acidiferrobacteraceae bacterium]|tara:strand:+ start:2972 stop:3568 length:597 start_codon:yes stop_codon:yes gene_type:complete